MICTIKTFIKNKGEAVTNVANKLHLSRPTFDTYVMMYEEGIPLPKERYQKLFDLLFQDEKIPTNSFKARLDLCDDILMGRIDQTSIHFFSRRAERMSQLVDKMQKHQDYQYLDADLYEFICLLMEHYSEEVFFQLVQYFLLLYGKKDVKQVTPLQKAYYSELFRVFAMFDEEKVAFSLNQWEKYEIKCENARLTNELKDLHRQKERISNREKELRRQINENRIW